MTNDNQFQKEKKTVLVVVSIAWVICIILIATLAVPFTMQIYKTKDSLDESKLKLDSIKSDLANSDKYRTLRESIGESKLLLEQAVLKESTVINFIQDLERTAKDTGNVIAIAQHTPSKAKKKAAASDDDSSATAAAPAEPAKGGQYFELTVTGGYTQLLNFIAKLENLGYVFRIESIYSKSKVGTNNISLQDIQKEAMKGGNVESKIIISFSLQK